VRRAAAEDRVALVPVATLEDHGPHLPVDTDLRIVTEICERAAAEAAGRVVLLPAIPHGYDPHHMDFPGAITIGWDTFTRYLTDVGRSLAHHGFRRMLFLNGHGSNQNLVEMAARLVMVERPEVLAAARSTWRARRRSRSSSGSGTPPGAVWRTPASWRPRSTWRSTRTRSTWTWRSTSAATRRASMPGWTGRTGR
jgi:creatinine amidohydrolase/Fe(II)-dependent formamide hydrolase-like protein